MPHLDIEKYRYQKFISDIAGHDIQSHDHDFKNVIKCVRNWLSDASKRKDIPGASEIVRRFNLFNEDLPAMCKEAPIKVNELTFNDYMQLISTWLSRAAS